MLNHGRRRCDGGNSKSKAIGDKTEEEGPRFFGLNLHSELFNGGGQAVRTVASFELLFTTGALEASVAFLGKGVQPQVNGFG